MTCRILDHDPILGAPDTIQHATDCECPPKPEACEMCGEPLPMDDYGNTEAYLVTSPSRSWRVCARCFIEDVVV